MDLSQGMNQFAWNLLYPESERIEGMILWNGVPGGIVASPGNYFAKFKVGKDSVEVPFTIKADPNYKTTQAEYEQQFAFLKTVQDKFNETQKAIKDIRALRSQITSFMALQDKEAPKEVKQMADSINKQLTAIEETLYQTKAKSGQDVLNFPIRLNDKLSGVFDVANSGNFAPSKQSREVYADLASQIDVQLNRLKAIKEKQVPAFNELIRQKALPLIGVK
jgi:prophage DNA circulation protein